MAPQDPALYWHLFEPDGVPEEAIDDNGVYFPSNLEELEDMLDMWEDEDATMEANGIQDPLGFAESLGFAID